MSTPIIVSVKTNYLPEQSDPAEPRFVFAYTITLENQGSEDTQLLSRHWVITDGNNAVQEVKGLGVIGEQPTLSPGKSYTYSSGVVVPTQTATMQGSYHMRTQSGVEFEADIPLFPLLPPKHLH